MAFEGKSILITGGSTGIGAACAEYFAKEGALLALVGRNAEKFESVVDRIKESGVETEPLVIVADVSVDAERIINETIEKYGRLDILINNAGWGVQATIETTKMDDFDKIFAINVRGLLELTQLAIPHLEKSKGNIINVSTCIALCHVTNFLAYSMSKAAVDHFTKCIALELASKGIRVNSINPGFIDTEFHTNEGLSRDSEEYANFCESRALAHPIGRIGFVDDCVNAVVFLAKENSSFLTGVLLPVDGGLCVKSAW